MTKVLGMEGEFPSREAELAFLAKGEKELKLLGNKRISMFVTTLELHGYQNIIFSLP